MAKPDNKRNSTALIIRCLTYVNSVSHMLLLCETSIDLWGEVKNWIKELGMENYNLSPDSIILGDMENATSINTIILLTKKSSTTQ